MCSQFLNCIQVSFFPFLFQAYFLFLFFSSPLLILQIFHGDLNILGNVFWILANLHYSDCIRSPSSSSRAIFSLTSYPFLQKWYYSCLIYICLPLSLSIRLCVYLHLASIYDCLADSKFIYCFMRAIYVYILRALSNFVLSSVSRLSSLVWTPAIIWFVS